MIISGFALTTLGLLQTLTSIGDLSNMSKFLIFALTYHHVHHETTALSSQLPMSKLKSCYRKDRTMESPDF